MFENIEQHADLYGLQRSGCSENGYCVIFCDQLLGENGELDDTKVKVLQVDSFYNSGRMHNPPPSIDCLIIVNEHGHLNYSFYLVELRNVIGANLVKPRVIQEKFITTFTNFLATDFPDVFIPDEINLICLKAWLVTDPYRYGNLNLTDEQYKNKIKGTVIDQYNSLKPFRLKGVICMIEPILPNPFVCYSNQ
jgi:hypothetical protein